MPKIFRRLQDIKLSEKSDYAVFYNAWRNNDYATLATFLTTHPDFEYKIIKSSHYNFLIDKINNGTDGTNVSTYSATTTYQKNDLVKSNNYVFIARTETTGNAPVTSPSPITTTYWEYMSALTSPTTDSIVGLWNSNYASVQTASTDSVSNNWSNSGWSSGVAYKKHNLVRTVDPNDSSAYIKSYFCILDHTSNDVNKPPNSTYWIPASIMKEGTNIPVSSSQPSGLETGDIWIKTTT